MSLTLPHSARAQVSWAIPGIDTTNDPYFDQRPDMIQRPDGSIVMVYSHEIPEGAGKNVDLYGRIYMQGQGWSQEYRLTADPHQEVVPSLALFRNGTLMIVWASDKTGNLDLYMAQTDGTRIWNEQDILPGTTVDTLPTIAITRSGTLWLFWVRFYDYTTTNDIFYKALSGGAWSSETLYTAEGGLNQEPSAYVTKDDRVWLTFEKRSGSDWDVYLASYQNGLWTSRVNVSQSNLDDESPHLVQDRSGTIWVFWTRDLSIGGQQFQGELYSSFSSDNGATFPTTNISRITYDPPSAPAPIDDLQPAPVQAFDKRLWVAYMSDPDDANATFEIYVVNSTSITGVHDVGVASITAAPSAAGRGRNVTITVGVRNFGDYDETIAVSLYAKGASETLLGTRAGVRVLSGQTVQVQFNWLTGTAQYGRYTFRATVTAAPGETVPNRGDNNVLDGSLNLTRPQDVDHDGDVDLDDIVLTYIHLFARDLNYDVDFDGDVDLDDMISVYQAEFT